MSDMSECTNARLNSAPDASRNLPVGVLQLVKFLEMDGRNPTGHGFSMIFINQLAHPNRCWWIFFPLLILIAPGGTGGSGGSGSACSLLL
jgi:hypothetical protein